ncbi:MAG: LysR family transcriptional regulator [Marinosulfonomonas sp.]
MPRPPVTPSVGTASLEWGDLSVILAICRSKSLSGASRELGQTHSTVFRKINVIEAKTGVRFFDRFKHGYVMTPAGQTAMQYAERVEREFHALEREMLGRDTQLKGRIRVTCPEAFAEEYAPAIIASFCEEHSGIQVDLTPGHGALDLNKREAEIAIRATKTPPETSFGKKVSDFRFAMYGREDYVKKAAGLPTQDRRYCMIEGSVHWLVPHVWDSKEIAENCAVFQCRASRAVQNAAASGLGLSFLPCYVGDSDPRLIRASDTFPHLDMNLWVLTHPDLRKTSRVRAFMSHLYEELAGMTKLFAGASPQPGARKIF